MFSICIPNYNYEKYLAKTLDSVSVQTYNKFEIVIADNCSTDASVDIVGRYQSAVFGIEKLKFKVNTCNVGFSGNLDQAALLASNPYLIMLSSDDLIKPDALFNYHEILNQSSQKKTIICSATEIIDSNGVVMGEQKAAGFRFGMWDKSDIDPVLSRRCNADVYRVNPGVLLKRALLHCANPFNFCATCYSRELYDAVGGYGGSRIINPDKWFHWRIIGEADEIYFIDKPLFQYRWHNSNQTAQQKNSGHLKFLIDEYRNSVEITDRLLSQAGITRTQFNKGFLKYDIYRHGIGEFMKGRWLKSFRIFLFGLSTYPALMFWNMLFPIYSLLLLSSPLTSIVLSIIRNKSDSWKNN